MDETWTYQFGKVDKVIYIHLDSTLAPKLNILKNDEWSYVANLIFHLYKTNRQAKGFFRKYPKAVAYHYYLDNDDIDLYLISKRLSGSN
jgi:hypothetical protein